jgi:signal transduction histidine kinase/ligand-binding sensor domain-containing protein/AraC-like DNA-binding protein/ActR/RegA family two-component response regulator
MYKTLTCCCLLLLFALNITGQNKVRYLTIDQGLANNTVTCISKDRQGFMWFGTYDGLNRFDGYVFSKYSHIIGDSSSLADNLVTAIAEDNDGRHWVAAAKGVSVLDDKTSLFSHVKYLPATEAKGKSSNEANTKPLISFVNCIVNDAHGNMLAGADQDGLVVFKKGSLTGKQVALSYHGKMLSQYSVKAIFAGKEGKTWLYVASIGICLYDTGSGSLIVKHENNSKANCFLQVQNDTLLVGTDSALYQYDTRYATLTPYKLQQGEPYRPGRIMSLCNDQAGRLWVGTDGHGMNLIDLTTHRWLPVAGILGNQTISSNAIYCVYNDVAQRIWVGTFRGGVDIIDHGGNPFFSLKLDNGPENNPSNNFIFSFCEDKNGDIWIGTDGGGISIWNRKTNTFKKYSTTQGTKGLTSNNIPGLVADDNGNVLVATYGGGILKFDPNNQTFHQVSANGNVDIRYGWRLYKDRAGDIWAGCGDNLLKYDKITGRLVPLDKLNKNDRFNTVAITEDRNNHLWLGGSNSLQCIDKKGNILYTRRIGVPVRSILEGRDGAIWLGTQGNGLLKFYSGRWQAYTEKQGLSNNTVLNILEDNNGAIWVSTFNGISKLIPEKQRFENFFDVDGLQSNQFYINAALKLRSGEMLFGGIKGFTLFKPEACVPEKSFPPLSITGIKILNEELHSMGQYVKGTSLYVPDKIEVPYSKAVLSVDFAALEYSLPGKIKYTYFLKGWDKTWSPVGSLKTAYYAGLKEGNYVLRIKCTNTSGIWNPKELQLPIIVLPPWYRSWWFQTSVAALILVIMGVLLFYWEQHRQIQYKMKITELQHRHEMELNEKRLSFFTNISHEFRSPLTLIINPIKQILNNGKAETDSYNLGVVYSNAQRLLKMTDQLLLFRKADSELGKMEMADLDLLNLCRQVYFCFSDEAQLKSLTYEFHCLLEQAHVYADPEKIEIIIYNLIANAIKFSPQQGRVSVKLEEESDQFIITVSDNGPGIPNDTGDKLFSKFYQAPDKQSGKSGNGFGIGLYLAKSFADMHQADLSYHCPQTGGAIFTFSLKKIHSPASINDAPEIKVETEKTVESEPQGPTFLKTPVTNANTYGAIRADDQLSELLTEKKVMLVIDNDRQLTAYIKNLFSYLTVYEAENGSDGWKKVQELSPDIILCDIVMDESNGIEVCKKIKSSISHGHIPVILLTGCSAAEMRLKGMECGADDYILKPFESELLTARVNNILKDREVLKKFFFNEITLQGDTLKVSDEFKGFLADCIALVEENIDRDDFDSNAFAKKMGMSRTTLYMKVKAISGLSVNEFVKLIRLRKAAELMINTNCQIKEVSFQVGFSDPKYFREQFTRLFQLKPSEYIKKYRKSFQSNTRLNSQFSKIKNK